MSLFAVPGWQWLLPSLLALRVVGSLLVGTYFNPDEYWQGPEVAHRMVFGYGFKYAGTACTLVCQCCCVLIAPSPLPLLQDMGVATRSHAPRLHSSLVICMFVQGLGSAGNNTKHQREVGQSNGLYTLTLSPHSGTGHSLGMPLWATHATRQPCCGARPGSLSPDTPPLWHSSCTVCPPLPCRCLVCCLLLRPHLLQLP